MYLLAFRMSIVICYLQNSWHLQHVLTFFYRNICNIIDMHLHNVYDCIFYLLPILLKIK